MSKTNIPLVDFPNNPQGLSSRVQQQAKPKFGSLGGTTNNPPNHMAGDASAKSAISMSDKNNQQKSQQLLQQAKHLWQQKQSNLAIAINSLNLAANYLLAELSLYQKDLLTAKKILKKILYLDPESIKAPLELERIYQQAGDR